MLRFLFRNVFNSVPFGIATMVAIGLYIGVGSGWVGLRESLEMDEMLFFNWWPLKVLIVLLISNLTVVTVNRIPLTVPRYGVWTIHLGIILLMMSLSAYYKGKTEGLVALTKGRAVDHYYDRWERALYIRTQFGNGPPITLDGLPRFHDYDEPLGNASALSSLHNLLPQMRTIDVKTDRRSLVSLGEAIGVKDPIHLDVIGYYPFAHEERWRIDPAVNNVALRVRRADAAEGTGGWLVASQAAESITPVGEAAIEHRHLPTQADVDVATGAAKRIHKLSIRVGAESQETFVEPGEELDVGATGYTVKVEGFTPNFELSDGKSKADTLTVLITKKSLPPMVGQTSFRRTILSGQDTQTDFELGVEGAGPFGKRKKDGLLDEAIHLAYTFSDPTKLLPTVQQNTVKYLLFTCDDSPGITLLRVSARGHSTVNKADAQVDLEVTAPPPIFDSSGGDHAIVKLNVERFDHVAMSDRVIPVPMEQRDHNEARGGMGQMLRVRVKCGEWSQVVPVPFDPFPIDNDWQSPKIHVPGATGDFQLMLGNVRLPLPLTVRLEKFEPIPYAGNEGQLGSGFMRDFRSTITLIDEETGQTQESTVSLNDPAFFTIGGKIPFISPSQSWLLSQASWNPDNLDTTVLQVGNRPAVNMMVVACGMIFTGLMYAFYAKPLIVRRMKARAIREAKERNAGLAPASSYAQPTASP